ncbi:hypothetical protein FD755_010983 [Muntiacus reevesi]|uniref:Cation channel sperm-associated protein subunit epsilon n=1 Tax=Muntiacus reevesi TaxID=9886 RepID=A0A5N3XRM5_MUNRE|nr:hypothetical protein FD755_010983 [Muntiacus reevesi]
MKKLNQYLAIFKENERALAQKISVLTCKMKLPKKNINSPKRTIYTQRLINIMISVHFQGTPFSITVIQVYATTTNAEEAEQWSTPKSDGLHSLQPEMKKLYRKNTYFCFVDYAKAFHCNQLSNQTQYSTNIYTLLYIKYVKCKITSGKRLKWYISVPMTKSDVLKEVKGNPVAFQDCFIANSLFLLTSPMLTIPEIPGFLPISSPRGIQLIASWAACSPSFVVVVADMETFQTNDSFHTWTRIRVPPNILTEDERHNVSDVTLSRDGIFFLINGILYLKNYNTFTRLGSNANLPDGGIIGITSRRWCWINYLLKDKERRSDMAIWTENEVYLGYTLLKFVKIVTTEKLKGLLNMSPTATLTIHNVEYTGHPLELALLLNYCIICNTSKTIYLVIYNEDTIQWVFQDFALDVTIDTFLIPYFLYSAMPELLLWDKHRIYYYYHNFTDTGVLQTSTEFGNLSRLSQNSIIHNVLMDYYGNIVVKMENNVMFYFKLKVKDAIKLHLWTNSTVKSLVCFKPSGNMYLLYVFENGNIYPEDYPLKLEAQSISFKTKEKCPYMAFHNDIVHFSYLLDKGQNLSVWAQIVYPENIGLYIIVESYGPKILEMKDKIHYEIASGYCSKTMARNQQLEPDMEQQTASCDYFHSLNFIIKDCIFYHVGSTSCRDQTQAPSTPPEFACPTHGEQEIRNSLPLSHQGEFCCFTTHIKLGRKQIILSKLFLSFLVILETSYFA